MSHSVVLTDISGNRVSVFPWSLHVRCSRYTCSGEVFIGYDIHASKDNVYSDDGGKRACWEKISGPAHNS